MSFNEIAVLVIAFMLISSSREFRPKPNEVVDVYRYEWLVFTGSPKYSFTNFVILWSNSFARY
jgi:hypothetical protein